MVTALYGVLGLFTAIFAFVFGKDLIDNKDNMEKEASWVVSGLVGLVANFFDTLGIGSFAPTTAALRALKQIPDRIIPGTLNVSCTIPVIVEAFIFITVIEMDVTTLIALIAAATVGSYVGAGIISKFDERKIQLIMAFALYVTLILFLMGQFKLMPIGGDAVALEGTLLIVGVVINFILGALMTAGIGLYAPCMAMVALLGMNPGTAFPVMMGSCAFLMPVASIKFIKEGAYSKKASLAITVCGVVGVLIAAYIVKSLPLDILRWLVDIVVFYTATTLLMTAMKNKKTA